MSPRRTSSPPLPLVALGSLVVLGSILAGSTPPAATALPEPGESTFVPVTPTRVLDTRDPVDLGLAGPFVSPEPRRLQVTGTVPTAGGPTTVVPGGATAVMLNVTVVAPTAAGFVSVRPGDATGAPTTSNLNVDAGETLSNAVTVALPTSGARAGQIELTFDAYGAAGQTADLLVDVLAYSTRTGLQDLVSELAGKADTDDVYTRDQLYTRGETDAAIADGPAAGSVQTIDDPLPTGDSLGTARTVTFETTRGSRLAILVTTTSYTECTTLDRLQWLEIDGVPLRSSVIANRAGGDHTTITLHGITPNVVAPGTHELTVQQGCAGGGTSTGSSVFNAIQATVIEVADDTSLVGP